MWMDAGNDFSAFAGKNGHVKLVGRLAVQPESFGISEICSQSDGGVGRDAASAGDDAMHAALRHAGVEGEPCLAYAERFEKFLLEKFSGMNRGHAVIHWKLLMVIDDFHIMGVAVVPDKTDSPLPVNADAVHARPVPGKGFKMISWRDTQILQGFGVVQNFQFAHGGAVQIRRQFWAAKSIKNTFCPVILETAYHNVKVTRKTCYGK